MATRVNPFDPTFPAAPRATCREAPHQPELHRSALAVRRALSAAPARSLRTSRQRVSQRVEHLANLQQGAANGARPVREVSPLNIGARNQHSHVVHSLWVRRPGRAGGPGSSRVGSERCRGVRLTSSAQRSELAGMKKSSLRKRGILKAPRAARAGAMSGECSAASLRASGLPPRAALAAKVGLAADL